MTRILPSGGNAPVGNEPAEMALVLHSVATETGRSWGVVRRFRGGANGGAYLLRDEAGAEAVLKVQASDPDRILAADRSVDCETRLKTARMAVEASRMVGWPTPRWQGIGEASNGIFWALQDCVAGGAPPLLDARVADQLVEIFSLQAGALPGWSGGWDAWVHRVIDEDWEDLRARVEPLPGGDAVVRSVDSIATACSGVRVTANDLVHGDFNLTNTLTANGVLWVIDAESLHCGPRALDPIKTLIVAGSFDHATPGGIDRIWAYARTFDPHEFALCAAAAALKIAEGVVRHRLHDIAPAFLARKVAFLDRVRAETGI
jgi:hypothetical protein